MYAKMASARLSGIEDVPDDSTTGLSNRTFRAWLKTQITAAWHI